MRITDLGMWQAFEQVARQRSFTKAAVTLKVGVPLLSKRIARLEEEIGARLFHRSTRVVSLTDEGRGLLGEVESILEDLRGLESRFEKQNRLEGTIRMTCLPVIAHRLLIPIVSAFTGRHPEVEFEIDTSDSLVNLVESGVDLALRIEDSPPNSNLIYKRIMPNELILCASPSYLKTNPATLRSPRDLGKHALLFLDAHEDLRFVGQDLSLKSFGTSRRVRSDSGMLLTELALQGCGIALRSIWDVQPFLKSGKLVRVLAKHPIEPFGSMYAVIPSRRMLAYRVRAFSDFLLETLSS